MRCLDVRQSIYTYLDGQLAAPLERSLHQHLAGCPCCQEDLGRARKLNRLLESSITQINPPVDISQLVMQRLELAATAPAVTCAAQKEAVQLAVWRRLARWAIRPENRTVMVAGYLVFFLAVGALFMDGDRRAMKPGITGDRTYTLGNIPKSELPIAPSGTGDIAVVDNTPVVIVQAGEPGTKTASQPDPSVGGTVEGPVSSGGEPKPGNTEVVAGTPTPAPVNGTPAPPVITPPAPKNSLPEPGGPFVAADPGSVQTVDLIITVSLLMETRVPSSRPVWSADNREIWYLAQKEPGLYAPHRISLDGRQNEPLNGWGPGFSLAYGGGVWSPKRDYLAYVTDTDGYLDIRLARPDGTSIGLTGPIQADAAKARRAEMSNDGWAYWPVWSVNNEIAYLTTRFDSVDIMVAGIDGVSRVVTQGPATDTNPVWSPDGKRIAFYRSQRDASGKRSDRIFTVKGDGTDLLPVTPVSMGADSMVPAWSPDGKKLAINAGFMEPQAGARQRGLWVVNADGSSLQQLTTFGGGRLVSWSPDGKKIAFNDSAGVLYVVLLHEQPSKNRVLQVPLTGGDPGMGGLTWSADSQQIIFDWAGQGNPTRSLWVANLPRLGATQ